MNNFDPHTIRTVVSDGYGGCIEEARPAYEPNNVVRKPVPCPEGFVEGIAVDGDGNPLLITEAESASNYLKEEADETPKRKALKKKKRRRNHEEW